MDFVSWLQMEIKKRGWSQTNLSRSAEKAGFPISQNQLSRILGGRQQAGVKASIAIAHGLGVPREEVFRVHGWLLTEPEMVTEVMAPELAEVFQLAQMLSPAMQADTGQVLREVVLGMMRANAGYEEEKEPSANRVKLEDLTRRLEDMEGTLNDEVLERAIGVIEGQVELLELTAKR